MKASDRKELLAIQEQLAALMEKIEDFENAEQEALDARSEKYQEGEKGERDQTIIDALSSCKDSLDSAIQSLDEVQGAHE